MTANSPGGPHVGPQRLAEPIPCSSPPTPRAAFITVVGTLNSTPNATFTLDFYSDLSGHASGHGQGGSTWAVSRT